MITISKAEAKMIREKFPRAHMVTTVHKTMVDETRDVRRRTARTLGDEVVA